MGLGFCEGLLEAAREKKGWQRSGEVGAEVVGFGRSIPVNGGIGGGGSSNWGRAAI